MFVDKGARTLAREILAMDQDDYAATSKGSAVKRAKLWVLQRNAAVVLENLGTAQRRQISHAGRALGARHDRLPVSATNTRGTITASTSKQRSQRRSSIGVCEFCVDRDKVNADVRARSRQRRIEREQWGALLQRAGAQIMARTHT
jgi:hypothetical protein